MVDFSFAGEVGAKIKVWKWELADWTTDLDFGLNWNLFKYPKDNSNGDKDAEDYCDDNEVEKNVKEITKSFQLEVDKMVLVKLENKLNNDTQISDYANRLLSVVAKDKRHTFSETDQKKDIIKSQLNEFSKKYGRAPQYTDDDYKKLVKMVKDKIKAIAADEIKKMSKK